VSPESVSILERELVRLGLNTPDIRDRLSIYLRELERWSRKVNLTSLEGEELVRRLISDPARVGKQLQLSGVLADIGSGNGSPGLPLYVTCRLSKVHLVEARARRAAFLRHVASMLDPQGIIVHKNRAEEVAESIAPVDWISMQAVRPSSELLNALRPLCRSTTRVVWITSATTAPVAHAKAFHLENSNTVAWVFQRDQF
jgi:16S rRNA (guanine527-N7)-methyltransferase